MGCLRNRVFDFVRVSVVERCEFNTYNQSGSPWFACPRPVVVETGIENNHGTRIRTKSRPNTVCGVNESLYERVHTRPWVPLVWVNCPQHCVYASKHISTRVIMVMVMVIVINHAVPWQWAINTHWLSSVWLRQLFNVHTDSKHTGSSRGHLFWSVEHPSPPLSSIIRTQGNWLDLDSTTTIGTRTQDPSTRAEWSSATRISPRRLIKVCMEVYWKKSPKSDACP